MDLGAKPSNPTINALKEFYLDKLKNIIKIAVGFEVIVLL